MDQMLHLLLTRSEVAGGARISTDDIALWGGTLDKEVTDFFNRIGGVIAVAYQAGDVTYEFCDQLVNDLFGWLCTEPFDDPLRSWPHLFCEVFEAFDAGEYCRRPDKSDDPVSDFTNPAIAHIVAKLV